MNLAYGRLLNLGLNPYITAPTALPTTDPYRAGLDWLHTVDAWGPIPLYVSSIAARADSQAMGLLIFKLVVLAAVLLSVILGYRYCATLSAEEGAATFFFFACNPLLAWELSGQAHNDAVLVLAATAFLWAAAGRRHLLALVLLCVGSLAKYGLSPVLGLYWLMLWRDQRLRALLAALGVALLAVAVWMPFFAGMASFHGLRVAATPDVRRVVNSLASIVVWLGDHVRLPLFPLWSAVILLLMACVAGRYALRAHALPGILVDSVSFTLLYQTLAMSSYWPWYATWLLPLGLAHEARRLRPTIAFFTAAAPALYLTGLAGGLANLVVHGVTLVLWLRAGDVDSPVRRRA